MLIVSIVLITGKTVHLCLFSERQKNKCVLNVQRKKKPSPTYKFCSVEYSKFSVSI